ncbi:MBL fold metallo-hydrolase [Roseovarius sp. SCSIO 43702]|uniref:MBL fold metallo-hydrolase n=1 Tax=Roseovarius sp. SCSIO 43702 TaxID=2823043 RepID=UPI001C73BCA1|nr:MBL fold metallo-hydrolase [Roseovarius sp. SCSIO 43702]QYX57724.1 MBL fold metallo-hydrolase [Roseovarius sp. SCSIO 43702]
MTHLTRRRLLGTAAALPLASAAQAAAPLMGVAEPRFHRVTLGDMDVTTILAGTRTMSDPHSIFGLNVDEATFAQASEAANIPTDEARGYFTPTVVNTGDELVLFDTGLDGPGTVEALSAAGYAPDQVDLVVITHMHGDHIGGLMTDGAPTFTNARYATGSVEFDAWSGRENEGFETRVRPLADRMTMLADGDSVARGITAQAAFGHTPGHMVFTVQAGGQTLLIAADFANHYVWSLAHPDWEVKYDMDKQAAAATRRRLLDRLAADRTPFVGYHMPFPALGYVERAGDGFSYVPQSYQLTL